MKFKAILELHGKTATGFTVPEELVMSFSAGKRPPVAVIINGYSYRSTVSVYGGVYMLPLSAENRAGAGVSAGEEIEVNLELDHAPRVVSVPDDLNAAINADPKAKAFFEGLSFSNKNGIVQVVEGAKAPETRLRRIEKAVNNLREGKI